MLQRLWLLAIALAVALGSFGIGRASPVAAAEGQSPEEGILIPYAGYQVKTWLERGERRWYRVPYAGGGSVLGITLHLRKQDADVRDAVNLSVNILIGPTGQEGEAHVDWPGYGRIGVASTTSNTGDDRKFWLNNFGEGQTYYLLVKNESGRRLPIAITTQLNTDPSAYELLTGDVPEPTPVPVPTPTPTPVPTAVPTPPPAWEPLDPAESEPTTAEALAGLIDRSGNPAGIAHFFEHDGRLEIIVEAHGLAPGLHAIDLHQVGACEPPSFESAGEHVDTDVWLGHESPDGSHAGDLPHLVADEDGNASFAVAIDGLTLSPGPYSLLDEDGSALVIYALDDDDWSDPVDGSELPIACGVIVPR